jgi:hypothetical protein
MAISVSHMGGTLASENTGKSNGFGLSGYRLHVISKRKSNKKIYEI